MKTLYLKIQWLSCHYSYQIEHLIDLMGTTPLTDYKTWVFIVVCLLIIVAYLRE